LANNTIRLAVATLRVVLSAAVENGILASNPGLRLGRFIESQKAAHEAQAMTREEAQVFLEAAKEFCPEFHPLSLMALRAGLRKGELLAVRWGDIQFGIGDNDPNRYICPTELCTRSFHDPEEQEIASGRHVTRVALRFTRTEGQANAGGVL
jgi:hypothetical protein